MARKGAVPCVVEETELETDEGREIPGVVATCRRCDHQTQSFGTEEKSILRCFWLMREECPRGEKNYYIDETDSYHAHGDRDFSRDTGEWTGRQS